MKKIASFTVNHNKLEKECMCRASKVMRSHITFG